MMNYLKLPTLGGASRFAPRTSSSKGGTALGYECRFSESDFAAKQQLGGLRRSDMSHDVLIDFAIMGGIL